MSNISNFTRFVEAIAKSDDAHKRRIQHLANIILEDTSKNNYAVQITLQNDLLLEHEHYKKFAKTNNMYARHPQNINIPVKAHYHVVDSTGKKEIYAVNIDGTAHHKVNRGIIVPKKEADELRSHGVKLDSDNILVSIQFYNTNMLYDVLFLIID